MKYSIYALQSSSTIRIIIAIASSSTKTNYKTVHTNNIIPGQVIIIIFITIIISTRIHLYRHWTGENDCNFCIDIILTISDHEYYKTDLYSPLSCEGWSPADICARARADTTVTTISSLFPIVHRVIQT